MRIRDQDPGIQIPEGTTSDPDPGWDKIGYGIRDGKKVGSGIRKNIPDQIRNTEEHLRETRISPLTL
jgi:hypothetical protein